VNLTSVLAALALLATPFIAHADCQVTEFLDLPVTITNMHPLAEAQINGAPAKFVIDSGASINGITPGAAKAFHLDLEPGPAASAEGIGGGVLLSLTTVKIFTLARYPFKNIPFLVGGSEVGDGAAGLLGQELLGVADIDYDFAAGMVRFIRPKDCGDQPLAYWLKPGQTFAELDVRSSDPDSKDIIGVATVNGVRIKVLFDTGGGDSLLSLAAAKRAGASLGDAGVVDGGAESGVGSRMIRTWIAPFKSFEIGGEQILNTRLRIGDWANKYRDNPDMILGDDFFLAHHVYVANSQHKVYFTYNGGPVFNLEVKGAAASDAPAPTTASAWASLGAVALSRETWSEAIADYGHAIELDPRTGDYYAQRGRAHAQASQPELAAKDFDRALELDPADVCTRLSRAQTRTEADDLTGARSDLTAVDGSMDKASDFRLELANAFDAAALPHEAIPSFNAWIAIHPDDSRMTYALADRCWAKAMANEALDTALGDCQRSLRLAPGAGLALEARGIVFLREGAFDKAIADETGVLAESPQCGWCLEARGAARIGKGDASGGKADLAAAAAINSRLPERAKAFGLQP